MSASDENESRFKKFSNLLLAAEETVHRSGEVELYSPEALHDILSAFCKIVADDIDAQSCTIHLKLHDLGSCKFIEQLTESPSPGPRDGGMDGNRTREELEHIERYRKQVAAGFTKRWDGAGGKVHSYGTDVNEAKDDDSRRDSVLRGANAFPHCIFPKGAMWLVAANPVSPWLPFVGWLMTELSRGVTAEIVQEKSARVRDPFNIRKSRAFRKLGEVDPYVWTNARPSRELARDSPRFFFNYYAVPIRIHSGGDVIGIIKIENKGFAYAGTGERVHEALNRILAVQHSRDFRALLKNLSSAFEEAEKKVTACDFKPRERSLLSLVYLAYDLSLCAPPSGTTIEPLLTEPFMKVHTAGDAGERPPVQIFFDTIAEERSFLEWLTGQKSDKEVLKGAGSFYTDLNDSVARADGRLNDTIKEVLLRLLRDRQLEAKVEARATGDGGQRQTVHLFPDFLFEVDIVAAALPPGAGARFHFHVQVCPSETETGERQALVAAGLDDERADVYNGCLEKQGSLPVLSGENIRGTDRVIHLRTDRLAARVHALTYAFPVPCFSVADSWKLSWAALEIGKLIERQISYRGTHVAPTVPLIADDFFRIPISDLSFVDSVRQQEEDAQASRNALQYHLPNLCRDLGLTWGITHGSRVKGLRSYFDRLGQSHRAYHDALLAVWSYIFVRKLKLKPGDLRRLRQRVPDLAKRLSELAKRIETLLKGTAFDDWQAGLDTWLRHPGVFPDLRFAAPPLNLDEARRKAALECLRENLEECPTGVRAGPAGVFDPEQLVELLYRRYDTFVMLAVSLYLQLDAQGQAPAYLAFYSTTRMILEDLRGRLEAAEQQVTRAAKVTSAITEVSRTLGELRVEVLSLSTMDLADVVGAGNPSRAELLRFSVHGIYNGFVRLPAYPAIRPRRPCSTGRVAGSTISAAA